VTADVLGLRLERVRVTGGSALGAAFAAGMGTGQFAGWREIQRFVQVDALIEPRPDSVYDQRYRAYRALYPALKGVVVR
jgi:sugar (pentulose or hexulose) kinase